MNLLFSKTVEKIVILSFIPFPCKSSHLLLLLLPLPLLRPEPFISNASFIAVAITIGVKIMQKIVYISFSPSHLFNKNRNRNSISLFLIPIIIILLLFHIHTILPNLQTPPNIEDNYALISYLCPNYC